MNLNELIARQYELRLILRAHLASDDPDSAEILDLATELRANDDSINEILLDRA